jgi:hypothetical protein
MQQNKQILTYILLLFFLYSCKQEEEYYYLYGTDRLVYKEGDTLIYRSNNDDRDTLKVSDFGYYFVHTFPSNDCYDFYQVEDLSIRGIKSFSKKLIDISRSAAYFYHYSHPEDVDINFSEQVNNSYPSLYYGFDFLSDSLSDADTLYKELQIENKVYKNVFYGSFENAVNYTDLSPRTNIYYNKTYGLLRYDINGETWSLCEIKPER